MAEVSLRDEEIKSAVLRTMPGDRPFRLKNASCPYCGHTFKEHGSRTLDHVIRKNFVPKGYHGQILEPAPLGLPELQFGKRKTGGRDLCHNAASACICGKRPQCIGSQDYQRSSRKGRARSSVTGRYVAESRTKFSLVGQLRESAEIRFDTVGPPQLNPANVLHLATMHVRALAYLLVPEGGHGGGGVPPIVMLVHECGRGDWGNKRAVAFARLAADWPTRLVIPAAANGYFRASVRRNPASVPVWSWALEWNQSYRLMGFLGYTKPKSCHMRASFPLSHGIMSACQMTQSMEGSLMDGKRKLLSVSQMIDCSSHRPSSGSGNLRSVAVSQVVVLHRRHGARRCWRTASCILGSGH